MGEFQPFHWLLVLVVAMVLFGPKKLPEIGRSLGQSINAFKKGLKEGLEDKQDQDATTSSKSASTHQIS